MATKKWEKFERLVAAIHAAEQKGAVITWDEKIKGRQFDVTVRFKQGLYEYLTVVECKDYQKPVSADKVDALVTKARDAGADKAILIAASGFQEGAIEVAKRHNIKLFSLKSLSASGEGEVTDMLMPVLWVYDFKFKVAGRDAFLALPDEPGILRMFMRDMKIQGPGIETIPEQVVEKHHASMSRSATTSPQILQEEFPGETVVIHPNFQTRTPVSSFSFEYRLITAGDLKTTEGLGVDPYFTDSIYKLEDEITKEIRTIDSSNLEFGFNTVLEPGKFYHNPNLEFSYYCEAVNGDLGTMALIESYQGGRLFQATGDIHKDQWGQFVEVIDEAEIKRLKKVYERYLKNTGSS